MNGTTRREAILTSLFGAGGLGLRALFSGIPAAVLLDPRRASADACYKKDAAQYLIWSTSGAGDPLNANAPGSFDHPSIIHSADPEMAKTALTLPAGATTAAKPWTTLPPWALTRAGFFHHTTLTNSHANQPKMMRLMGAIKRQEMLVSLLSRQLAGCLGTLQREPISVGGASPGEALSFGGRNLPILRPTALRDVLTAPTSPLTSAAAQKLRDADLDALNALYRDGGTTAQRQFLERYALSQQQARSIPQDLLSMLSGIKDNGVDSQLVAALALVRMNVTPVITIRLPFGGDNHTDADLKGEAAQTQSSVAAIGKLLTMLKDAKLEDRVTFASMNVFGRTLTNQHRPEATRTQGRDHFASHHVTVLVGKRVRGGVYGGVGVRATGVDVGAMPINSKTGKADLKGDIAFDDTLGAVGKTIGLAVGTAPTVIEDQITLGKAISAALV